MVSSTDMKNVSSTNPVTEESFDQSVPPDDENNTRDVE